ncbi:MAG: sulfite exporter TauE/SafE family protein [Endozoicomonadaceae bacterium]|nr:sulfite exporter TauE/SafE family protein [Endozoicomonadaceae bacterium]
MFLILYFFIGSLTGFLAGLMGNGGLILVPTMIFALSATDISHHIATQMAIGTALASMVFTSANTTWQHYRKGSINVSLFLLLTPGLLLGSWLGGFLIAFIDSTILTHVLALFCILAAFQSFQSKKRPQQKVQYTLKIPTIKNIALVFISIIISCIAAISGLGGAFMTIPILLHLRFPVHQCIATASACTMPVALMGTCSYIILYYHDANLPEHTFGYVYWPALLCIIAGSLPASKLGVFVSYKLKTHTLQNFIGCILLVISAALLIKLYL